MVLCFRVQRDKESLIKKESVGEKGKAHFVDTVWRDFTNRSCTLRERESRSVVPRLGSTLKPKCTYSIFA